LSHLDGLCGVYAVLNALQWLVPAAQNYNDLAKLFNKMMGSIINIDHVRDGGEEPEIEVVHAFVAEAAKRKFKVNFVRVPRGSDAKIFKTPESRNGGQIQGKGERRLHFRFRGTR
jgi:hypothetical protein